MPLEWKHYQAICPKKEGCSGDTACLEFPTIHDRLAMAQAAYREYSEADDTPLVDFVADVLLLAMAEGIRIKITDERVYGRIVVESHSRTYFGLQQAWQFEIGTNDLEDPKWYSVAPKI
jgi:hypothetical protein